VNYSHSSISFAHRSLASALKLHEDDIFSQIKENGITELVFTGHSLGGGIAQVAHLLAKAQSKYNNVLYMRKVLYHVIKDMASGAGTSGKKGHVERFFLNNGSSIFF
jgi:hypothetical protein